MPANAIRSDFALILFVLINLGSGIFPSNLFNLVAKKDER